MTTPSAGRPNGSAPAGSGPAGSRAVPDAATLRARLEGTFVDPAARVVVLGKPGCHLCEVAREVVGQVCAQEGEHAVDRSTLDDVEWEMAYWELIPVVFVDGREVAHWRVDPERLRAALRG